MVAQLYEFFRPKGLAPGIRVNVTPLKGYTSEALLESIADGLLVSTAVRHFAFIIAAPGGRKKLFEALKARNWQAS